MAINPEDIGIDDQPDLDLKFLREPEHPTYQLVFPWGAGGNIVRHLIALHPGQEYLDIHGNRIEVLEEKFQDLVINQYPISRAAASWLTVEWTTRHLYDESRIEHHPPGSWHHLPTIIIDPDLPEVVAKLYEIKNPGMNGWELPALTTATIEFSQGIPTEIPLYKNCMVIKFSDLIKPFDRSWYLELVKFLDLKTSADIEEKISQVHLSWRLLQQDIWIQHTGQELQHD